MLSTAIAYSPADGDLASRLDKELQKAGISAILTSNTPGLKLHRIAEEAIKQDRVIVLVSRHALQDPHVYAVVNNVLEVEFQEGAGTRLLPIDVDGTMKNPPPDVNECMYKLWGRVSLPVDPWDKMVQRLLKALEKTR